MRKWTSLSSRTWSIEQTAIVATLIFWLLTCWTRYPFLADDYFYAWRSYFPDFGLDRFDALMTRRPLATLLNELTFSIHIFEKTSVLFIVYFFLHCWSLITLFRLFVKRWFPSFPSNSSYWIILIEITACLYPDLFENNLMALNLPYTLGLFFIAWAFRWQSLVGDAYPALRIYAFQTFLMWLSFCCLETWVPATAGLWILYTCRADPERPWDKKFFISFGFSFAFAAIGFFLTEVLLSHIFVATKYDLSFQIAQVLANFKTTMSLLFLHGFYKVNWPSTLFDFVGFLILSTLAWRKYRPLILCAILFPIMGSAHQWLYNIYAPRSIHGAMILRSLLVALLMFATFPEFIKSKLWRLAIILYAFAYLLNYGVIVYNRTSNRVLMESRIQQVEKILQTCQEPCSIDYSFLNKDLRWDWYLSDSFRTAFVEYINVTQGYNKKIIHEVDY